jgi:hypothetical protein
MTGGEIEETHDLRSQGRTAIHSRGNAGYVHNELRRAAQIAELGYPQRHIDA